jgi:hypothetical protein
MRNRIGAALKDVNDSVGIFKRISRDRFGNTLHSLPLIENQIEQRLGIHVPGAGYPNWKKFASDFELRDLLDTITIMTQYGGKQWIEQARDIFKEENISYSIDDMGGVHLSVDEEFNSHRMSAISVISHRVITMSENSLNPRTTPSIKSHRMGRKP